MVIKSELASIPREDDLSLPAQPLLLGEAPAQGRGRAPAPRCHCHIPLWGHPGHPSLKAQLIRGALSMKAGLWGPHPEKHQMAWQVPSAPCCLRVCTLNAPAQTEDLQMGATVCLHPAEAHQQAAQASAK